jgi:predicted extracellular nuclease
MTVAMVDASGLDPSDGDFDTSTADLADYLSDLIVNGLSTPDVIVLRGVLDNSGEADNGVTSASTTIAMLTAHISVMYGGPFYIGKTIDPADNEDGTNPGSNEHIVFLYNSVRVSFDNNLQRIEDPAFDAGGDGSPEQADYVGTVNPIAGNFVFKPTGETVTIIGTDLAPKTGDDGLYGATQPPVEHTLAQRVDQAAAINAFVEDRLAADPAAKILVAGNMNDFQFSDTLGTLANGGDADVELVNLIDNMPPEEQFTYMTDGMSQAVDHILVSASLAPSAQLDIVHSTFDFGVPLDFVPEHDPLVARIDMSETDPLLF